MCDGAPAQNVVPAVAAPRPATESTTRRCTRRRPGPQALRAACSPSSCGSRAERRVWAPGAAARWWLARSLAALDAGPAAARLAASPSTRATRSCCCPGSPRSHRRRRGGVGRGPRARGEGRRRAAAGRAARARREPVLVPSGNLLLDPAGPLTREGRPYTVFTPYWRRALGLLEDGGGAARERLEDGDGATAGQLAAAGGRDGPALPPAPAPPAQPGRTDVTALVAETDRPWAAGFAGVWSPGEAGARRPSRPSWTAPSPGTPRSATASPSAVRHASRRTCTGARSRPRRCGTASPAASPRTACQLEAAVAPAGRDEAAPGLGRSAGAFLRQLGWREFGHHLLHHFPHTASIRCARPSRASPGGRTRPRSTPGSAASPAIRSSTPVCASSGRPAGCTTAPGWWRRRSSSSTCCCPGASGEAWFWDTLVDADVAGNALGWQWVAGSGADAAPYFRVFNPVTQGRRYDPDGAYVRRWVPELAGLDARDIHRLPAGGEPAPAAGARRAPPTRRRSWTTARPAPGRSPPTTSCGWQGAEGAARRRTAASTALAAVPQRRRRPRGVSPASFRAPQNDRIGQTVASRSFV